MREYEVINGAFGKCYHRLLDFCAERASTYLLVVTNESMIDNYCRNFINALTTLGGMAFYGNKWPGTTLLYGAKALIIKGELSPSALQLIQNKEDSLFAWKCPSSPEDLCFIDAKEMAVLSSTTHELFASVTLNDEDFALWQHDELLGTLSLSQLS